MADEVVVVSDEETPPAEPVTVVVDTGDEGGDGGNDLEIGTALGALTVAVNGLVESNAAILARLDTVEQRAETATDIAIDAAVTADEAVTEAAEVAEEVAEEVAGDEVEELIEPQREHPIWRNPVRLRRGADVP